MVIQAGKLRPSQIVTQFGPGSLVDLPEMSMILSGIDDWNTGTSWTIGEPRLQRALGVRHFKKPPYLKYREGVGGVPATIFPRFLVCPRCNRLALHTAFAFTERGSRHLCKAGSCRGKGNASAYPARFMVACSDGHLDDFPWHEWVHPNVPECDAELELQDSGRTGSITDLWVHCRVHGSKRKPDSVRELADSLLAECPWLQVTSPDRELASTDDDALDALACALIARAAMVGLTDPPQDEEAITARREGWIRLPRAGSLHELCTGPPATR